MILYDTCIPIHETEDNLPSIHEIIERLCEMLSQYGISHCLTLPSAGDLEADRKVVYLLYFQREQNTELTLVISLFMRLYLKRDKQKLLEGIVKSFGKE